MKDETVVTLKYSVEYRSPDDLPWFYFSFCDPDRPEGSQFLGACFVSGLSLADAVTNSHLLGINPGGEIATVEVPPEAVVQLPTEWRNRLMSREEIAEFDRTMGA